MSKIHGKRKSESPKIFGYSTYDCKCIVCTLRLDLNSVTSRKDDKDDQKILTKLYEERVTFCWECRITYYSETVSLFSSKISYQDISNIPYQNIQMRFINVNHISRKRGIGLSFQNGRFSMCLKNGKF